MLGSFCTVHHQHLAKLLLSNSNEYIPPYKKRYRLIFMRGVTCGTRGCGGLKALHECDLVYRVFRHNCELQVNIGTRSCIRFFPLLYACRCASVYGFLRCPFPFPPPPRALSPKAGICTPFLLERRIDGNFWSPETRCVRSEWLNPKPSMER